jgi:hypothetical protein
MSEDKIRYTLVFEWNKGQEPEISGKDQFRNGKLISCQFEDALAKLDKYEDFFESIEPYLDELPFELTEKCHDMMDAKIADQAPDKLKKTAR